MTAGAGGDNDGGGSKAMTMTGGQGGVGRGQKGGLPTPTMRRHHDAPLTFTRGFYFFLISLILST